MRGTSRRGYVMIMVMSLVGVLLIVAALLLNNVVGVAANTMHVANEDALYNAADAGLNVGIETMDQNPLATNCIHPTGTIDGYTYTCSMLVNNVGKLLGTTITNLVTGKPVTIPLGLALVQSQATSPDGSRTVTLQAVLGIPTITITKPAGAVVAGGNVTGSSYAGLVADPTDLLGLGCDAHVHANGNIGSFSSSVKGNTYAAGTDSQAGCNGLNSNQTPMGIPPASAGTSYASGARTQAMKGTILTPAQFIANGTKAYTGNVYISGNVAMSGFTATFQGGGVVFIDGDLTMTGASAQIKNTGASMVVVKGRYEAADNAIGYTSTSGTKGVLVVAGGDSGSCTSDSTCAAVFDGSGTNYIGLVWAAGGSILITGSANYTGAVFAAGNVVFNGNEESGKFTFDHSLEGTTITSPLHVQIAAYAEY